MNDDEFNLQRHIHESRSAAAACVCVFGQANFGTVFIMCLFDRTMFSAAKAPTLLLLPPVLSCTEVYVFRAFRTGNGTLD